MTNKIKNILILCLAITSVLVAGIVAMFSVDNIK